MKVKAARTRPRRSDHGAAECGPQPDCVVVTLGEGNAPRPRASEGALFQVGWMHDPGAIQHNYASILASQKAAQGGVCGNAFQQTAPAPFSGFHREVAVALRNAIDRARAMMEHQ